MRAFARESAHVVIVDVDDAAGESTAREIAKSGRSARSRRADVTDEDAVAGAVREAVDE